MSTQLEELRKLQKKVKVFEIPLNPKEGEVQAKIEFTALALDDIQLLSPKKGSSDEEMMESNYEALSKSIGVEVKEIKKTLFGYFEDMMECMLEVNNIGGEDDKEKKPSRLEKALEKKKKMEDAKSVE